MSERIRPSVNLSATCACGAVKVSLKGTVYSMLMCSCLDCQKATGTGHATIAIVDPTSVTIAGNTKSFVRPADSGATFTRYFCPHCGTPLYGQSSRAQRSLMLPVGLFGIEAAWFAPTQLIFSRSHHDWDAIAEALPRYDTYREPKEP
jgi:hypothetical protein